jgi:hypothetical protein
MSHECGANRYPVSHDQTRDMLPRLERRQFLRAEAERAASTIAELFA